MPEADDDIRVVVAIDFGTTYSGYAYAHKKTPDDIIVQDNWEYAGYKTPTVIKYKNDSYTTIKSWGFPALTEKPKKQKKLRSLSSFTFSPAKSKPIELFKLHLLGESLNEKPFLPSGLDFRVVIKDYMKKLGESVKESLNGHWRNLDFYNQVLLVLTVPAEFDDKAIATIRECAFNADLLKDKFSKNLRITTEPEAAAIYCLNSIMKEEHNLSPGDSFMVVDCGGGTVDLTIRELLENDKLSELTERTGDYCGSSCIDQAFLNFVGKKIGASALESIKNDHYGQLQYLVQGFCKFAKTRFTGKEDEFQAFEVDLEPMSVMKQYVKGKEKKDLEKSEWWFEINFEYIKKMFDPTIEKIINLIRKQLGKSEKGCSAIFLVGGFSESKYLQTRIRKEFDEIVPNISVPSHPITSVLRGGVLYGLNETTVMDRVFKRTYGTEIVRRWQPTDPPSQRQPNGFTVAFETLAERGKQVPVNKKVTRKFKPFLLQQQSISFDMYVSDNDAGSCKFCDDAGVSLLRNWEIELPENEDLEDVTILFTLTFGVEILATAENQKTGDKYQVTFNNN